MAEKDTEQTDVGNKIKRALALTETSQSDLAKMLNVTQSNIAQWIMGHRNPSLPSLKRISKALDLPLSFFTSDKKESIRDFLKRTSQNTEFMRVEGISSAETERVMWQETDTYIRFPKTGENQFAIKVEGECMVNPQDPRNSIYDGDFIIVDPDVSAEEGDVVLARICKEYSTIKRLYITKNKIELKPDNPNCKTLIKNPEDVEIIGKVVNISRPLRKKSKYE